MSHQSQVCPPPKIFNTKLIHAYSSFYLSPPPDPFSSSLLVFSSLTSRLPLSFFPSTSSASLGQASHLPLSSSLFLTPLLYLGGGGVSGLELIKTPVPPFQSFCLPYCYLLPFPCGPDVLLLLHLLLPSSVPVGNCSCN